MTHPRWVDVLGSPVELYRGTVDHTWEAEMVSGEGRVWLGLAPFSAGVCAVGIRSCIWLGDGPPAAWQIVSKWRPPIVGIRTAWRARRGRDENEGSESDEEVISWCCRALQAPVGRRRSPMLGVVTRCCNGLLWGIAVSSSGTDVTRNRRCRPRSMSRVRPMVVGVQRLTMRL